MSNLATDKDKVQEPNKDPADIMAEEFGSTKPYQVLEAKQTGLRLSALQSKAMDDILFAKDPESVRAFRDQDRRDLPVHTSASKYFKTLPAGKIVKQNLLQIREKRGDKGDKLKYPMNKKVETQSFRQDQAIKLGLRHTAYAQWLLTSLKKDLKESLGAQNELMQEDSRVSLLFNELFSLYVSLQQGCRASNEHTD